MLKPQQTLMQIKKVLVTQGIYKNREKNDRNFFLKFPLFYLANEEIQRRKIQNNIYILNFPAQFPVEFHHSQDKRARIPKKYLSFLIHIPSYHSWVYTNIQINIIFIKIIALFRL